MKLAILLLLTASCSAATPYVAQTSAGGNTGADCANARAVSSLAGGDWTAGNTIHLCGTITSTITVAGNGTAGNVITVKWETGARISQSIAQGISLNGTGAYLVFDGGIPCGPGTACDAVEAAHLTTYASGQAGIVEATANGSSLANQSTASQAFFGCGGCHDIEIKNMIIRNLYIHSTLADSVLDADDGNYAFNCQCDGGTILIHDSSIHDTGNALRFISNFTATPVTIGVYNIDFYRNNWAVENSGSAGFPRTLNLYNNHFHDTANWDTTLDTFHHNGLHEYFAASADSVATNIYNNLSDGDWGNCCTTNIQVFMDTGGFSVANNVNLFNNVCLQHSGNTAPCWDYAAITGLFVNNTAIGQGSNVALNIDGGSSGLTVKNNVITGWQQYIVVTAGATFTAFDYNTYGTFVASGNSPWAYGASMPTTFATWKTACSCDSHGQQNNTLLLNTDGTVQATSPVIGAALNLTSLSITALNSDYAGTARPSSAAWDSGAYQFSGGASGSSGGQGFSISGGSIQ